MNNARSTTETASDPISATRWARLDRLWANTLQRAPLDHTAVRSRLLVVLSLLSVLVNLLYTGASISIGDYAAAGVSGFTLALLFVVLFRAYRLGWRRGTAVLYLASAIINLALFILVNREVHSAITAWLPFIPMLAMLLLNRRDGVTMTILAVMVLSGAALYVEYLPGREPFADALMRSLPTLFAFVVTSSATLGVILVYVYLRDLAADRQRRERESKETLLRILCHDIANNLNIIRMSTATPNAGDKAMNYIRGAAESIIEIVDTVRSMTALEDGKLTVRLEPVDLHAAIRRVLSDLDKKAAQKKIRMIYEEPEHAVAVMAHRVYLEQTVLANILSNAVKFTPPNGVIRIRIASKPDTVTVTVRDNGVGIEGDLLPHVFDPGKHTSRTGTDGEPGTGFGLPLAKKFVEAFGGTIQVETATEGPEQGTTFIMTFRSASPAPSD